MIWTIRVAALLILTCFGGASTLASRRIERQSESRENIENALIELLHGCKCVKHYLCNGTNSTDVYGELNFKPRIDLPRISCKGTFANEMVCCKSNNIQIRSFDVEIPEYKACGFQNTGIRHEYLPPIDGEFPWVAAIYRKSNAGTFQFHCSGSLIHPKVVLTANHCIGPKKPDDYKVVVNGRTNCSLGNSPYDEKSNVSEIIKHPNYNSGSRYNDAALLILEKSFTFSGEGLVNTLCLPPSTFDLEGSKCIVAAWGKNYFVQNAQALKKVTVPFVNHDQCQIMLRNTRLGQNFNLDKSFICAGGEEGRGTCTGSGGSPLMCSIPSWSNQYSQVGIMSWGLGCGTKDVPGVYTSINQVAQWIASELQNRNLYLT